MDAPARYDHGTFGFLKERNGFLDALPVRGATLDPPDPFFKKIQGIFVSVRLDILRQCQGDRSAIRGIGQYPHGFGQSGQQLLRSGDPIEKPTERPESIIDTDVG